jgi:eukaryotic-like serine/threonine-protein kinase
MSAPSPCPPPDRLRQLLTSELAPPEQEELTAHLDDCPACQRALEEQAGADPALLNAAGALKRTVLAEEPTLRRVLDSLEGGLGLTLLYRADRRPSWVQSVLRPATAPDMIGRLDGYEVAEVLGQGGMGLVLRAFDPALKRPVAIKVLSPELAGDAVARQRFAREAQSAAGVRHAHVIAIHSVSESDGLPYLVMEYASGGSLQDYLDTHGPPDWRVAARLGAEIASGLAAPHSRGLVHRDIKPSNILLQADGADGDIGVAKIGDFGLARVADEARLTRTGVVAGTPMYMSPEQAQCQPLDERSDLFSLGSVLYTLCTGQEPFPAGSPVAVLRQVIEATPRPVRELNPDVPDWLAAAVARLQAKRPADRFGSAAEVAELLRYNLEHPDRPRQVAPPPERRPRRRLLLGAALVVALLVGAGLLSEGLGWTHFIGGPPSGAREKRLPLRATLRGHELPIWSVAFAPGGKTLATGSDDNTLRFWDASTGEETARLEEPGAVFAVAFARSGKFLVSGDTQGAVRVWDVATRKELGKEIRPHNGIGRRLALSPDDRTLALISPAEGIELWDLPRRKLRETLAGQQGTIFALAFSPDGRTLASGDARRLIHLWDPDTGSERASFRADPLGVRALAFSPDSRVLASAGTGNNDVTLWDVGTRRALKVLPGSEGGTQNLAFSPDRRHLAASGRDGTLTVWDVGSGETVANFHAHQGRVWGIAFSPDGRTLASAGEDRLGKLWDLSGLVDASP